MIIEFSGIRSLTNGKMESRNLKKGIFYGWYIVIAGLITYALGYGARYSFSVLFPALLEEFHLPRDTTAAVLSFHLLIYGFISPLAGHMVDRVGPRFTIIVGAVFMSLGLALSRWGSSIGHLYLSFGIIAGAGLCFMGAVPFTTIIKNWFERKRGTAFAIITFGTGGAFALYPGVSWLIERIGWRNTFFVEACIVSGIVIPLVAIIVRYHPREKNLLPDGRPEDRRIPDSPGKAPSGEEPPRGQDWTFPHALRISQFWLLALIAFSFWGVMDHIMIAHHFAFAVDMGYPKIYASSILSLFGITRALGSLSALISDRIGREMTITMGSALGISAIGVLLSIKDPSSPWRLYYYSLVFGYGIGLCSPTIMATIVDIVHGPKVGLTIGIIWFCFALGGTIGPWVGGWLFELRGNYTLAFMVAIAMYLIALGAVWIAAPRKYRKFQKHSAQ